ncbi:MAG TPA: FxLYD domain-containing protein, partial [Planctomycetota bacterium]|nr:FxLYD domain-containing protein [Planctomycetota bacterium]
MMLLWAAMQDPSAPAFTKFEFARERIEHKVTVDAVLSNPSGKDLADVAVTSVYYDGAKELRRSRTARIAKIAAGASAAFRLEAEQVPNFSRYEVYVEAGG